MGANTISLSQCKTYLRNIITLEMRCYELNKLKTSLNRKKNSILDENKKLEKDLIYDTNGEKLGVVIAGGIAAAFIGVCIGALVWIIYCIATIWDILSESNATNMLSFIRYTLWDTLFDSLINILVFIKYGSIGSGIIGILLTIWSLPEEKKQVDSNRIKKQSIETQIAQNNEKITKFSNKITICEKKYAETKRALNEYYSWGILYPKYRGLIPVSTIYEYLVSGRCFTLYGYDGAYNLYERELTMHTIVGKLDEIISRLDDISSSQHLLSQEIRSSNAQLNRITNTLDGIENNTALMQYYDSITATNTSLMSWLDTNSYIEQTNS